MGDSKRGPADLREEKGTEGGPVGANPPLSDKKEREYSCGGFETRSRRPTGGERGRRRPRRGALVRAIPLSPKNKISETYVSGDSKRGSKGYPPLSEK